MTRKNKRRPGSSGRGHRNLHTRVKTARGRKTASTRWLERQLNDPYVELAKKEGYRSRAAYKLIELDDKYHFLKPGQNVLDLGAAPGGWSQVAVQRCLNNTPPPASGGRSGGGQKQPSTSPHPHLPPRAGEGMILGIDLKPVEDIPGATMIQQDFMANEAPAVIRDALGGKADVVLSDMAPNATGHARTDHLRIMALCEAAFDFALEVLNPDGIFLCKVLQGGTEHSLLKTIQQHFQTVRHAKPPASRPDSSETYVIATGFKQG